jgi:D-3-phosphoglycerate dehydrogenase
MAAEELREYMEYGNIVNSVNYPNCSLSYTGKKRLSVLHKNEPNVVASITSALGKDGINIDNMVNKSRNEYSCTIVDIDSDFNDNIISALKQVSGVIKLRVIG